MLSRRIVAASAALAVGLHAASAAAEISIGLALGLTGPVASIGTQARRGAEAAVAAINANGGVNGEELRLQLEDDACDPKQAVAVANRLVGEGVEMVIGHLCSGAAIPAADVYAADGIVMITGSATNPTLTERGHDTIFRACGRDDQQGAVAAEMLAERFKGKNIALVHDKQSYGMGLVEQATAVLRERGVTPALSTSINAGEKDFSALLTRLKQENIAAVYYGGYHPEMGLMVRQARAQGVDAVFIGAEGLATNEFWAITGEAGAGTLFTYAPEVKTRPAAQDALKQIVATGAEPDNFAFYYYAAVQVLASAIEEAKSADPGDVADVMHEKTFDTVVGEMAFDEKGDLKAPEYVFYEWRDGKYTLAQF